MPYSAPKAALALLLRGTALPVSHSGLAAALLGLMGSGVPTFIGEEKLEEWAML
jgi:hypothetical protein